MASIDSFSLTDRILSCLPALTSCLPINSNQSNSGGAGGAGPTPELQGLLANSDDYDDSDAISLLSNIADSDSRRIRSRNRRRIRSGGGISGHLLACGLFGRSKSQIQNRQVTRGNVNRNSREEESGNESDGGTSAFREGESGDEDAGMLPDAAIAKLGSQDEESETVPSSSNSSTSSSTVKSKSKSKQRKEAEAIKRQEEEAEAAALEDQRLAEEETRLAAEEEAAIAKARRKAERRAAKAGLLKVQNEAEARRNQAWRTEAGAEAAAGGFGFAEEQGDQQEGYYDYNQGDGYGEYNPEEHYHQGEGDYGRYEEGYNHQPPQYEQEGIVHHHHHYYAPSPEQDQPSNLNLAGPSNLLPPTGFPNLPALPSPTGNEEADLDETTLQPQEEDEEEADIAGLSFGKKKRKGRAESGSNSNGGGSNSRGGSSNGNRMIGGSHNSGSNNGSVNGSGNGDGWRSSRGLPNSNQPSSDRDTSPSNLFPNHQNPSSSSSGSGRASYRDKPRRHERTGSKSSGASSSRAAMGIPGNTNSSSLSPTFNSPNFNSNSPSTVATSPTQLYSPNQTPLTEEEENGFNALSPLNSSSKPSYKSKGRRNAESSSQGSSSAAASRRARGIPEINESLRSSPVKSNGNGSSSGGGLNAPRNPTGANVWSKYNQSSNKKLEEEEVDGL